MCGIAGFAGVNGAAHAPALSRIVSALHHRGPDDRGELIAAEAGIGMARLSIVGIDNGRQPIESIDGRYAIVGNGEIYDAPSHRDALEKQGRRFRTDSDIEALLHLYELYGTDCFSRVNGMFAVAILDRKTSQVLIARDRLGIKPLFTAEVGGAHFFASELPALLEGLPPNADLSIDPIAFGDYLAHGYIPSPRTIYRGVRRLPPGHFLWLNKGSQEPEEWWRWPEVTPQDRPLEDWAEEVAELIGDSVRLRTLGDVPAGAFLSGGLDSSALLAALSHRQTEAVQAFTLGFAESAYDERDPAAETAEFLGAIHHTDLLGTVAADELDSLFRHIGEPFGDVSLLPTDRVARLASGKVKFVLSGDGGDELFGGYQWLTAEAQRRALPSSLLTVTRTMRSILQPGQEAIGNHPISKARRFLGDLASDSATSFLRRRRLAGTQLLRSLIDRDFREEVPERSTLTEHALRWSGGEGDLWLDLDRRFYLNGDILEKVDRATMRHSLEARVPLLDHRLVELSCQIPFAMHLGRERRGKQVLRRAIEQILPPNLFRRPKRGFGVPVDGWLRNELLAPLRERLLDREFLDNQLLDGKALEQTIERHACGRADHGHLLWALWSLATSITSPKPTPTPIREQTSASV